MGILLLLTPLALLIATVWAVMAAAALQRRRWLASNKGVFDAGTVEMDPSVLSGPRLIANFHGLLAVACGLTPEITLQFSQGTAPRFGFQVRRKQRQRSITWQMGALALTALFLGIQLALRRPIDWSVLMPLSLAVLLLLTPRRGFDARFNPNLRAPIELRGDEDLEFSAAAPREVQDLMQRAEARASVLRLFDQLAVTSVGVGGGTGTALRLTANVAGRSSRRDDTVANVLGALEDLGRAIAT